ncbi:MAG: Holliday junction resolvase RuvX [Ignavibacteria bacterium]|nr:Holliday junction resolvase RuvX [Ignavibacteria bacterium]
MNDKSKRDRYLAVDFGLKRIGIAITDDLKLMAFPRKYIENTEGVFEEIIKTVIDEDVSRIIIGHPLNFKSEATHSTVSVIEFGKKLEEICTKKKLRVEIIFFDERFTSTLAQHYINKSGLSKKKKRDKGIVDSESARIILEDYLKKQNFHNQ